MIAACALSDHHEELATVLVADDEVLIRAMVADYLRLDGWRVVEAPDVAEAKRLLAADPSIRLVLSDIQMPGAEDGVQLARHIRNAYPHVAVLLMSGNTAPEPLDGTLFMAKPFDFTRLAQLIRLVLQQRQDRDGLNR